MSPTANDVARAALPMTPVEIGGEPKDSPHPFRGTRRSVVRDAVPVDYGAGSLDETIAGAFSAGTRAGSACDFLYRMRDRSFERRGGQSIKFDTHGSVVGLLPAEWAVTPHTAAGKGARSRWMEEFPSDRFTDRLPSIATLLTTETIASGLDDGYFSTLWVRDQVGSLNYTLGSDYSSTTYPSPGVEAVYKVVPLWYDSGAGGVTRGVDEFLQRFFLSGSRRFERIGKWWYFPNLYGTPCRWNGNWTAASEASISTVAESGGVQSWDNVGSVPAANRGAALASNDDGVSYISRTRVGGVHTCLVTVTPALLPTVSSWVITYRARMTATGSFDAVNDKVRFYLYRADGGVEYKCADILPRATWTTSFATYTATVNVATGGAAGTINTLKVEADLAGSGTGERLDIAYVSIAASESPALYPNRIIPSGPIAPTHAGVIQPGTGVSGERLTTDGHTADGPGGWSASTGNQYDCINETTADDSAYIQATGADRTTGFTLTTPGAVPVAGDYVALRVRYANPAGSYRLHFEIREGGAALTAGALTREIIINSAVGYTDASFQLTDAEIASITADTADWSTLEVKVFTSSMGVVEFCRISQMYLDLVPAETAAVGGWLGKHRFYYSVAYRFEDDSVWCPVDPRAPNDLLPNGLNLCTIDEGSPDTHYKSIFWRNLPIGPYGVKGRLLLRTPKIDSSTQDNLQLNPRDLRVVWEIKDNTTTTYEDFFADDLAPYLDAEGILIHFAHNMPPRARHIVSGEMRVCHAYGGLNPCAIEISPVGRAADYDLTGNDETAALWSSAASYMRVLNDSDGTGKLTLGRSDGTTLTSTDYAFATYDTIQKLIDKINSTSFTVDGFQWRAQMAPGANPNLSPLTVLTPHLRNIASCVVSGQTITKSAGGLAKVAVGDLIIRSGTATTAYVTRIDSDTQLTFTGTVTAGTVTLGFSKNLGDSPTTATASMGYQRVIGNCLPGFLFFNNDYLDQFPIEKDAVWMTTAPPGANKSAANNFSGSSACKHKPPLKSGMCMGGYAVGDGFVFPFADKIAKLVNMRDGGTGEDKDFRLRFLNETSGCCGFVVPGPDCGFYLKPEGVAAADLDSEMLISRDIWDHGSGPEDARGDFAYEMPRCEAAVAADSDDGYTHARAMRGMLWVNYRASGSYPNRQIAFDFSDEEGLTGLAALKTGGWSYPLRRSMSAMCQGRRSVSSEAANHLYGWNDENLGSTGDGRVDEFETGDTDNGTAITGGYETPWLKGPKGQKVSPQECLLEHHSAAGSTGSLIVHRSYEDATSTLTPGTNALAILRELKMYPQAARVTTPAYFLAYLQTAGAARKLRKLTARHKVLPTYT